MLSANLVTDTVFAKADIVASEDGYKIFFAKDGQVTQLGCKLPQAGQYKVSFWDFDTKTLRASPIVTVTDANQFTYVNITPIDVVANQRYVLSINNTQNGAIVSTYKAKKKSNVNLFPFTVGSVTFEDNSFKASATTLFPDSDVTGTILFNFPDLTFVPKK